MEILLSGKKEKKKEKRKREDVGTLLLIVGFFTNTMMLVSRTLGSYNPYRGATGHGRALGAVLLVPAWLEAASTGAGKRWNGGNH